MAIVGLLAVLTRTVTLTLQLKVRRSTDVDEHQYKTMMTGCQGYRNTILFNSLTQYTGEYIG